jgi:hypothetical protein
MGARDLDLVACTVLGSSCSEALSGIAGCQKRPRAVRNGEQRSGLNGEDISRDVGVTVRPWPVD